MKQLKYILFIIAIQAFTYSCKKEANSVKPVPNSAITVVNAVAGSNPIITDFSGVKTINTYYSTTPQIVYGGFQEYSQVSGSIPVTIYMVSDTTHIVYQKTNNLQGRNIYSLFLAGADTAHVDGILVQDHPPYHAAADSVIGVRFMNLSTGSSPISVNLQGAANGSSVSSLAYKAITDFKDIPFKSSISQYVFEIRDAASGTLLTTYTYNTAPYQNITICVIGQEGVGATVPISAMQENNF